MNTLNMFLLEVPATGKPGGNWSSLLLIVVIFVIFWLFIIRPQNKKQKEAQKFRDSLQKGDKVITIGGIHGKIDEVKATTAIVIIDNNVKIEIEKSALVGDPSLLGQA